MIGIYKITNLINLKVYIGQSIDTNRRFYYHKCDKANQHLYNAIRKYGVDNFSFEVIEECTADLLNSRETFWIISYQSWDPRKGYNKTLGGQKAVPTKETRIKLSRARREFLSKQENRDRIARKSKEMWSLRDSESRAEVGKKISDAKSTDEAIDKTRRATQKYWQKDSHRAKVQEAVKLSWVDPTIREKHMDGKAKFKQFMSKNKLHWVMINNGIKSSRVLATEDGTCTIPEGWTLGFIETRTKYKKENI